MGNTLTHQLWTLAIGLLALVGGCAERRPVADIILHHGKIVTVDADFSIREAIAIGGGKIVGVGSDEEILKLRGAGTEVIDLGGKMVLPGLIDSHVHPAAAMTEFDHAIPVMEGIGDVLGYIKGQAAVVPEGEWIQVSQVFITRLRERRYPTRAELDAAAPRHPVMFATGPDASLNTLALKMSGIGRDFAVGDGGPGYIEKDAATGEPTGILRSCTRYVKVVANGRRPGEADYYGRTRELFADYNANGITSIGDRAAGADAIARYAAMREKGELTVRISAHRQIETIGPMEGIIRQIRQVAEGPYRADDPMLRVIGIKMFLDGGMLTGSAYMREPWGVSKIYSISDPAYRGVLFIPRERLLPMVRAAVEGGLQFTAHSVGDGAVHLLLDVYEEVNRERPIAALRPCITHSNFMSREALAQAARLGVVLDIQPAWLYLDGHTLLEQFGAERLRYFQPLRSAFEIGVVVGGGSDHMQKIGGMRSVNPYNPFLGMWIVVERRPRFGEGALHGEEALTREQAIRMYTINNARLLFREHQVGSLEVGKLADLVVVDRDLLECPVERMKETRVERTYLGGKLVYRAGDGVGKR